MKIRITGTRHDYTWYEDKIGQVFEVDEETDGARLPGIKIYLLKNDRSRGIRAGDCEIIGEWYEGLDDTQIGDMKENLTPLKYLDYVWRSWMADAFHEMPAEDRVVLASNGEWVEDNGLHDGWTYRLREDWQRPQTLEEWLDAEKREAEKKAQSERYVCGDRQIYRGIARQTQRIQFELQRRNII